MATNDQYNALMNAITSLLNALSAYVNNQSTTDADLNTVIPLEGTVQAVSVRLGQFLISQFDGPSLDAATAAVGGVLMVVNSPGGGRVTGGQIARAWAVASPKVNAAIPGMTVHQALAAS
jgi:ClpP class serine protease